MDVLISVLVALLVMGVAVWIITLIPFPAPWMRQAALAIIALIFLAWLLSGFGVFGARWHTGHP